MPKRRPQRFPRPAPQGEDAEIVRHQPGGYIGFYNPESREHETFALKGDARAAKRLKIKTKAQLTRRSMRYKLGVAYPEEVAKAASGAEAPLPRIGARAAAPIARGAVREALSVQKLDSSHRRSGVT